MMKNILLVEDNEDDIFLMRRALKAADLLNPLLVVTDGQQAVDYLSGEGKYSDREQYPLPCLVLLDMKLPYLNGLEVIKWIRQQPPLQTLLVVFLTSSKNEMDIDHAYRFGANAFLVKPPSVEKLAEMLKALKEFWFHHSELPPECFPVAQADRQAKRPSSGDDHGLPK